LSQGANHVLREEMKKELLFPKNIIVLKGKKKELKFFLGDMIIPCEKKSNLNSFSLGT
jgi:hypothetical protein